MKRILCGIFIFNVLLLLAEVRVNVVPDRRSRQYRCGEKAVFTVTVQADNKPLFLHNAQTDIVRQFEHFSFRV